MVALIAVAIPSTCLHAVSRTFTGLQQGNQVERSVEMRAAFPNRAAKSKGRQPSAAVDKKKLISVTREERREKLQKEVKLLEGVLLELLEKDVPNIFKVREILARLSKTQKKPNQKLDGDWMLFWASRDLIVEKVWSTGVHMKNDLTELKEIVLRLGGRKEGRLIEATEIYSRVGPFGNFANTLLGTYAVDGPTALQIRFDQFKDYVMEGDEAADIDLPDGQKEKILDLDVIYSSKKLIALQSSETENGECDFYILTKVPGYEEQVKEFLGLNRVRTLFN